MLVKTMDRAISDVSSVTVEIHWLACTDSAETDPFAVGEIHGAVGAAWTGKAGTEGPPLIIWDHLESEMFVSRDGVLLWTGPADSVEEIAFGVPAALACLAPLLAAAFHIAESRGLHDKESFPVAAIANYDTQGFLIHQCLLSRQPMRAIEVAVSDPIRAGIAAAFGAQVISVAAGESPHESSHLPQGHGFPTTEIERQWALRSLAEEPWRYLPAITTALATGEHRSTDGYLAIRGLEMLVQT